MSNVGHSKLSVVYPRHEACAYTVIKKFMGPHRLKLGGGAERFSKVPPKRSRFENSMKNEASGVTKYITGMQHTSVTTKRTRRTPSNGNCKQVSRRAVNRLTNLPHLFCRRARAPCPPNFLGSIRLGSAINKVRSYVTNFFFNSIALYASIYLA